MDALPPNALIHLPVLIREIDSHWPQAPMRAFLPAQVEQETCYSLKHRKCWSPYAELKTDREYGFGLGQITITSKFDNYKEAKKLDASLSKWDWGDRYNAQYQLRTLVLTQRNNHAKFSKLAADTCSGVAFSVAAYNGGAGGVVQEIKMCSLVEGCNPRSWFGNVELHSRKSKTKYKGYGKSFYEINREYVVNVLGFRYNRYKPHMER